MSDTPLSSTTSVEGLPSPGAPSGADPSQARAPNLWSRVWRFIRSSLDLRDVIVCLAAGIITTSIINLGRSDPSEAARLAFCAISASAAVLAGCALWYNRMFRQQRTIAEEQAATIAEVQDTVANAKLRVRNFQDAFAGKQHQIDALTTERDDLFASWAEAKSKMTDDVIRVLLKRAQALSDRNPEEVVPANTKNRMQVIINIRKMIDGACKDMVSTALTMAIQLEMDLTVLTRWADPYVFAPVVRDMLAKELIPVDNKMGGRMQTAAFLSYVFSELSDPIPFPGGKGGNRA